jgi:hypothetical protein
MSVSRPFKRTVRQLVDLSYANSGHGEYVSHPSFARDAWHYKRGFQIIDFELQDIFTYVEPADSNAPCFSHKIAGLLARTCIEIEANLKAILKENGYAKAPSKLNMTDYGKTENSHRLSKYEIKFPIWTGGSGTFSPFESWSNLSDQKSPTWYSAYNAAKHDRHENFSRSATFGNLIEAYCGLSVLIWAQFRGADSPGPISLSVGSTHDDPGFDFGPMGRTLIKPPQFTIDERYDFDWQILKREDQPFDLFPY